MELCRNDLCLFPHHTCWSWNIQDSSLSCVWYFSWDARTVGGCWHLFFIAWKLGCNTMFCKPGERMEQIFSLSSERTLLTPVFGLLASGTMRQISIKLPHPTSPKKRLSRGQIQSGSFYEATLFPNALLPKSSNMLVANTELVWWGTTQRYKCWEVWFIGAIKI